MTIELEMLYDEYLGYEFQIAEMTDRGISSGDPHRDRIAALRDEAWQRYQDAHGPRRSHHLDPAAHARAPEHGARGGHVRELQDWIDAGEPAEPAGIVTLEVPTAAGGAHLVAAGAPATILMTPVTSGHWILALDPTQFRTAATTYNLATMAALAYLEQEGVRRFFEGLGGAGDRQPYRRESVRELEIDQDRFCSILRRVDVGLGYGTPVVIDEPATDTQLFMVGCPRHILISFRGSTPVDFLASNLDAVRIRYPYITDFDEAEYVRDPGGWLVHANTFSPSFHPQLFPMEVHRGFFEAFHSVRERVYSFVRDASPGPGKPIFVTGHSLGGALAVHAAAYLSKKLERAPAPLVCCTFGQPRVGDRDFATHFAGAFTHIRVTGIEDPVPRVPYSLCPGLNFTAEFHSPMAHGGHRYDCNLPSHGLYDAGIPELQPDSEPLPPTEINALQHPIGRYQLHCIADVWRAILTWRGRRIRPARSIVPLAGAALPDWEVDRWEEHHHTDGLVHTPY